MIPCAWIITQDFSGIGGIVGTTGPECSSLHLSKSEILQHQTCQTWCCLNEHGEGCCVGLIAFATDTPNECGKRGLYCPLDDYCMPELGCVAIEYLHNNTWLSVEEYMDLQ